MNSHRVSCLGLRSSTGVNNTGENIFQKFDEIFMVPTIFIGYELPMCNIIIFNAACLACNWIHNLIKVEVDQTL